MERLARYWKVMILVICLLALLVTISMTSGDRQATIIETVLSDAFNPVLKALNVPIHWIEETCNWLLHNKGTIIAQNEQLKKEALRSQHLEALLYERERELQAIRRFLNYSSPDFPRDGTMAKVIGRNPDNWFSTVVIDRGSNHGISNSDVVLAENGLVGRVYRTSGNTSSVLLLTDPSCSVGAMIQRSRYPGITTGIAGSDMIKLSMFSREADVEPGDKVVTSGIGSMYPKGILIGIVNRIYSDEYGLVKSALVEPSADFGRLEEVIVIKGAGLGGGNGN